MCVQQMVMKIISFAIVLFYKNNNNNDDNDNDNSLAAAANMFIDSYLN
jgi:hypothetical protein